MQHIHKWGHSRTWSHLPVLLRHGLAPLWGTAWNTGFGVPKHLLGTPVLWPLLSCRKGTLLINNVFAITSAILMGISKVARAFELIILSRVLVGICAGTLGQPPKTQGVLMCTSQMTALRHGCPANTGHSGSGYLLFPP